MVVQIPAFAASAETVWCPRCEVEHHPSDECLAPAECQHCEGKGWGFDFKGGKIVCPECGGKGDFDSDPQCVCGTYLSEHRLCGCREGFRTKGQWEAERDMIVHMDEDSYEAYSMAVEAGWY